MDIEICFTREDFSIKNFNDENWERAREAALEKYWSGEIAPASRRAKAKILWSETALYVRFQANQAEPLVVSEAPNLKTKTLGLWDRDVCEIFIAPKINEPQKYFEFEIAPNGEWLDAEIQNLPEERKTNFDYDSKMQSAAKIETSEVLSAIKIEWKAFGKKPKAGDVWLGNLFRAVGSGKERGYLAWQPTKTEKPDFHVPEVFGKFVFVK